MSYDQFTMWQAYYAIDPWGDEFTDYRFGTVAATIAQVNGNSKTKASDFFPDRNTSKASNTKGPITDPNEFKSVMSQAKANAAGFHSTQKRVS